MLYFIYSLCKHVSSESGVGIDACKMVFMSLNFFSTSSGSVF